MHDYVSIMFRIGRKTFIVEIWEHPSYYVIHNHTWNTTYFYLPAHAHVQNEDVAAIDMIPAIYG